MKAMWKGLAASALAAIIVYGTVHAAGFFTNGVPPAGGTQYPSTIPLTGNELLPADTTLASGQNPASEAISINQLGSFVGSLPTRGNLLIGGDGNTNLFQRATTGASVTTTATYGGPDRWFYWSGTNTAMTVSKDTTAADLPAGGQYPVAFKMARTASQTGVVQMCFAQEIESANMYQAAGQTVELDFWARAGANFSAASNNLTAYISYGTSTDEGASKYAFGLNAGGGGSTAWTGQANATAAVIPITTTPSRYAAVATIPSTATEAAVAICFTPVGTAGANDYVALAGIQLVVNSANKALASATVGYPCAATTGTTIACATFDRTRMNAEEYLLQYRYFWQITEPAASKAVANGNYQTATICDVQFAPPTTMRVAPAITIGGTAESATTWAVMVASVTPVALASTYLIQDAVIGNTPNMIALQATTASKTAGQGCTLVGAGGGANIQASAEL